MQPEEPFYVEDEIEIDHPPEDIRHNPTPSLVKRESEDSVQFEEDHNEHFGQHGKYVTLYFALKYLFKINFS